MRKKFFVFGFTVLFAATCAAYGQAVSPCDINSDGAVNIVDYQAMVNMVLGGTTCAANINGYDVCNIVTSQRIANAVLGQSCTFGSGSHNVTLTWTASTSTGVTGYNVYRATVSGGPYTKINTALVTSPFLDDMVQLSTTYFYVATAVAGSNESSYSNEASAAIPSS
jgi:hypothetical protein